MHAIGSIGTPMSPPSQPPSHLTLHPTLQSVTFLSGNPIKLTPASSSGPLPLPSDVTSENRKWGSSWRIWEKNIFWEKQHVCLKTVSWPNIWEIFWGRPVWQIPPLSCPRSLCLVAVAHTSQTLNCQHLVSGFEAFSSCLKPTLSVLRADWKCQRIDALRPIGTGV